MRYRRHLGDQGALPQVPHKVNPGLSLTDPLYPRYLQRALAQVIQRATVQQLKHHTAAHVNVIRSSSGDVKDSMPDWTRDQNVRLSLSLDKLPSVLAFSIWPRPGLGLVNLALKNVLFNAK